MTDFEEDPPRWRDIAHEAQKPPPGAWRTWLFQGGRGAGKTRAGAEWLAEKAEAGGRFALVGATLHDAREVMIDGPSGLLHLPGRVAPRWETSRRRLVWSETGALAYVFSAEEPERLRGHQFEAAWADEFGAWPKPDETLANLRLGLRLGVDPRLVVTTTPRATAAFRRLRAERSCVVTQAGTIVNAGNLAPAFIEGLMELYGGTRRAAQEIDGLMVDAPGALFRAEEFERAVGAPPAEFDRVVLAIDPPAGLTGAACGIVAAGAAGGRLYVLADLTEHGLTPNAWAQCALKAARETGADEIVAEGNQGGAMVRSTLAVAGSTTPIRIVYATEGKRARAEPLALLYEQGRVTQVKRFPALEEELMALGAGEGGMADRADALVWAATALLPTLRGSRARIRGLMRLGDL